MNAAKATEPVISVGWLREQLDEPSSLIVLDASVDRTSVDGKTAYSEGSARFTSNGHVPGALHADLIAAFSDATTELPFTKPTAAAFEAALHDLGIAPGDHVVIYDSWDGTWAARLWWVFSSFGFTTVSVLDGGLTAWTAAGFPVETGHGIRPKIAAARIPTAQAADAYVDRNDVLDAVEGRSDALVICGLRPDVFRGDTSGFARRGHIPGSINIPYATLIDRESKLFDDAAIERATAEIPLDTRIITYCGGGVNAAGVAFALRRAGFSRVSVYDGSLYEWANDDSLPLDSSLASPPETETPVNRKDNGK